MKKEIGMICLVGIIVAGIYMSLDTEEQMDNGIITISQSCLDNNEFYMMNNFAVESCVVNIKCFGNVEHILVLGNVFACDGSIDLVFSNATKIHVGNNHISHSIQFLEIDEFVFEDTPTMDAITIRGN